MNNEINGVTVSNIGIYMCIDDPLNIYSSINNPKHDIVLTDQQLNIQNFNESIQRKINNTFNLSSITTSPTTTTETPTTTTETPTETPTTTTETPTTTTTETPTTTTTETPTTTTEMPTTVTTTKQPITITNPYIELSNSPNNMSLNNNDNVDGDDASLIITLTSVSCLICLLFCIRCNPLIYEFCKRKFKKYTEKKEPQIKISHPVNLKIQEKKTTRRIAPIKIPSTHHAIDIPPQVITPKRKISLGFNTMGQDQDWYRETFQTELNEFKDVEIGPPAPRISSPNMPPIPTLHANLKNIEYPKKNHVINQKMDNIINDIEQTKKDVSNNIKKYIPNMSIPKMGQVQHHVHSIEKRKKDTPEFRNVRLNSWTNQGQKGKSPGTK